MSIRPNPNLYPAADKDILILPEDERKALLDKDTTKCKEEIIYYRERCQDLLRDLKSVMTMYREKKEDFSKEMVDEHNVVDELRKQIKLVDAKMKERQEQHNEIIRNRTGEYEKQEEELVVRWNAELKRIQDKINLLRDNIKDLEDFENKEMVYRNELEELSRKRDYEREKINKKQDAINQEEDHFRQERDIRNQELHEVEEEKNECEQIVKVGSKELEKQKIDNQNVIDNNRKLTHHLADKNKGIYN